MNKPIVLLALSSTIGFSLLSGIGTYALLRDSTSNGPNQFSNFSAETIHLQNATNTSGFQSHALLANKNTQLINFPMYYDYADYPAGPNPYDHKTSNSLSGELPGGWAPGDSATRYFSVSNLGSSAKFTEISAKLGSITGPNGVISPDSQTYSDFLNHMKVSVYSPDDNYKTPVFTGTFQQLIGGKQPLETTMYLYKGCSNYQPKFVASMDLNSSNDLQGVKGILDFNLSAEQCRNNWFDPPFDNDDYCMQYKSTTPIKFECYDSDDNFQKLPAVTSAW